MTLRYKFECIAMLFLVTTALLFLYYLVFGGHGVGSVFDSLVIAVFITVWLHNRIHRSLRALLQVMPTSKRKAIMFHNRERITNVVAGPS